jgi:hypothetical protein
MARTEKTIWLPFGLSDEKPGNDKSKKIQLNPISAITQSESKNNVRMILAAAALFTVYAVVMLGNSWKIKSEQTSRVSASVDLKSSVRGTIIESDTRKNTFSMTSDYSIDPEIAKSGVEIWHVSLPPGGNFADSAPGLNTCFKVPDLSRPMNNPVPADCFGIIHPGREVTVQYIIIRPEKVSLVARMIFAQK